MRGVYWKFYNLVGQELIYDNLLLDCYKVARYAQGGATVEYLKSLPLDELFLEIEIVNKAAAQEKMLLDSAK